MGPLAEKQETLFTYGDYLKWDDGERWELIDGVAYNMSPAPSRVHQKLFRELFVQFVSQLRGTPCEVYSAPFDVRLPEGDEAEAEVRTVVQPDISVFCDASKLDDKGAKGSPDLIVEILSPGTALKDTKDKFLRYERAGVREYWIVDPSCNLVTVFKLHENGLYGRPDIYEEGERITAGVFEGVEVDLEPVFRE